MKSMDQRSLTRSGSSTGWPSAPRADPLPLAFANLQTLFTVYPVHRLVIDLPAFPAQQNMQSPVAKTTAFAGYLDDPFA